MAMNERRSGPIDQRWWTDAASVLRELPEPGWDRIADAVVDAVRATARGGSPVSILDPPGVAAPSAAAQPGSGTLSVSDLVVRGRVSEAVRAEGSAAASIVEIDLIGRDLTRIRIELTARYGSALHDVADRIRTATIGAVDDLLGIGSIDADGVEVVVTDVDAGT